MSLERRISSRPLYTWNESEVRRISRPSRADMSIPGIDLFYLLAQGFPKRTTEHTHLVLERHLLN